MQCVSGLSGYCSFSDHSFSLVYSVKLTEVTAALRNMLTVVPFHIPTTP